MHKDALRAVEKSMSCDSMEWCEATEYNIYWLRRWSNDAARTDGSPYGETHHHDRWMFRGLDYDENNWECDWCVAIEPPADGAEVEP